PFLGASMLHEISGWSHEQYLVRARNSVMVSFLRPARRAQGWASGPSPARVNKMLRSEVGGGDANAYLDAVEDRRRDDTRLDIPDAARAGEPLPRSEHRCPL